MSDEVQNYNALSRVFHWSVAALILSLLVVGFYMDTMEAAPLKFQVYDLHKAFGITVIILGVSRLVWRLSTRVPESLSSHKYWEKLLSKTIHIVLYCLIIAMPLSGWVMSSAGGHAVSFFGLFEVPSIVQESRELSRFANQLHGILAYALIGAIGLHIVGALKHHVVDRDATLSRMGGHLILVILGILFLGAALFIPLQKQVQEFFSENVISTESGHDSP